MNPLKRLFSFIKPYRGRFFFSMLCTVIYTFARATHPFLIGLILSELARNFKDRIGTGIGWVNMDYVGGILILLIIAGSVDAVGDYLANRSLANVVQNTMLDIRRTINQKINHLPVSYFDANQTGEVLSRVTNDVDTISNAMQQGALRVLSAVLTLIFSYGFMFYIAPFFALIALCMVPICFFAYSKFLKKTQPEFQRLQDILGNMNGFVQEYYTGFSVIKLFGQERNAVKKFKKITDELYDSGFKSNFAASCIQPILSSVTHIFYVGLFLICVLFAFKSPFAIGGIVLVAQMEIGAIQSFIQYVWQSGGPISDITQLSGVFQAAAASLSRVFTILDEEEEVQDAQPQNASPADFRGSVAFEHVAFGYNKSQLLMRDISFDVNPGDTIAVVGPTGAGKTTLINLLMRFYDVDDGQIKVDGVNIQDLTRSQLRSLFGMVLQDPWLYYASIADNIRFGKLDATEYQVVDAAKTANVHHFIRTLADGYGTMLNKESSNISQGQKQLLTIARVLIGNPKIVILDEATSSIDTRLEMLIQKAMKRAMKGRTSFVIAHRLSTIRDADLILVMNNGSIVEQGTHDELLGKNGMYKTLYESQFAEES